MQVLPDPDEPLVHLYAEGDSDELGELEREIAALVTERDRAGGDRQPGAEPLT